MKNEMAFTVHDILERSPKDFKNLEIQLILLKAGIKAEEKGTETQAQARPPPARPRKENCCIKTSNFKCIGKWFKREDNWLERMRGNLSLAATMISAITFQALINPPGGFIQQGLSSPPVNNSNPQDASLNCSILNGTKFCPGEAITSFTFPNLFGYYVVCNTFSFVSSLCVTLLLVSGFPLKNKAVIWMLSLGMCVTLTYLALAYYWAAHMVIPDKLWETTCYKYGVCKFSSWAWHGLVALITVFVTLRIFIWVGKICVRAIKLLAKRNHNGCCCFV